MGGVARHDGLGHLGQPGRDRLGPELVGEGRPQRAARHAERALEPDPDDARNRHQVVAQTHAVAVAFGKHLDVGVAPQRDEVVDGLPDVPHGQPLADPGLDQGQHRGLGHRPPRSFEPQAGHAPAEQRADVGRRRRRQQHDGHQREHLAHQNVTRLRTSSA